MGIEDGQMSVVDCFREQAEKASSIEIAVGYVSKAALIELDEIIRASSVRKIILTMGMYYVEGMTGISFILPIKVPAYAERHMPDFIVALRDDPNLNDVSMGTYARDLKTLMRFFMKCE